MQIPLGEVGKRSEGGTHILGGGGGVRTPQKILLLLVTRISDFFNGKGFSQNKGFYLRNP